MKKYIIGFIIGSFVFSIISVNALYIYQANNIDYSPNDNTWQVNNAGEALTSLKSELNDINTNVNEGKANIIEALSNKGVEVNENSSNEDITNSINSMGSTDIYYLGTAKSYDIKTLYPSVDYTNLTANNFIVDVISGSASGSDSNDWGSGGVSGSTSTSCSKSYNNSTGVLTISCNISVSASCGNGKVNRSGALSTKAYMIIGTIN